MSATDAKVYSLNRMNGLARKHGLGDLLNIRVYESDAATGGGASEALTVTGLGATDTILAVTQKTAGASGTALVSYSSQAADSLTIGWTADPGSGAVIEVLVLKAAGSL